MKCTIWICLFTFLFSGCASIVKSYESTIDIGLGARVRLMPAKDIFPRIQLIQLLTFDHKDFKNSIQVVLTAENNTLTIVGLLPFGGEAFRIKYSDGSLEEKFLINKKKEFDLKMALADIILIYMEKAILESALSSGTSVKESELMRTIYVGEEKLSEIQYDKKNRLESNIVYKNLVRKYSLKIKLLSLKYL